MKVNIDARFWVCLYVWTGEGFRCHMLHPHDDYAHALARVREYMTEKVDHNFIRYFVGNNEGFPCINSDLM